MRAGGCSLQQSLTQESIAVVKQAITLARRRGHAQVTPLHVASTMLSSSTGLLRSACLQSRSHPLQCKALELCFNVALNRLPASTMSSPMLAPHHNHHHAPPSLSNALIAAFKRSQAHQRRGSIDTQQQPLLAAVKIELEQLVISILDDPSVSRVMREAGFSSTQVKANVEQTLSMENNIRAPARRSSPSKPKEHLSVASDHACKTATTMTSVQVRNEDVTSVVETLARRRKKSIVIVGECLDAAEAVVGAVMEKANEGAVADEVLRKVQFITLPLFSFRQMTLEEVDQKVGELKSFVKSCCLGRGVVLRLKDLDWAAEYRASRGEKGRSRYCPLEHVIMEIRNLLCCEGDGGESRRGTNVERLWLMAAATYHTYMRCRCGNPSLETLWGLEPLTVPAQGLGLSLYSHSGLSQMRSSISGGVELSKSPSGDQDDIGSHVSCGAEHRSVDFDTEAQSMHDISSCSRRRSFSSSSKSTTPSWLRRYDEANIIDDDDQVTETSRKWKHTYSCTSSQNHPSEITFNLSSFNSPSSSSVSSHINPHHHQQSPVPSVLEPKRHPWRWEHHFWPESDEEGRENYSQSVALPFVHSTSMNFWSRTMEMDPVSPARASFKELNAENLKALCEALEKSVAWQQDIIPEIASTVLRCRSGLIKRKDKMRARKKEETWLLFQGCDTQGKERIAKELARLVFGSYRNYLAFGLDSFSSTRSDSSESLRNKRSSSEAGSQSSSYLECLLRAIREYPHRVIVIGNMEQADHRTLRGIKRAMERGVLEESHGNGYHGEEVSLGDAIIVLSCESFDSRSGACSPPVMKHRAEITRSEDVDRDKEEGASEVSRCLSLDLNLCAAEDDGDDEEYSFDNIEGLAESVDRTFFFKMPEEII